MSPISILGFALMASTASAHMIMSSPVPYGKPNNSPLSPSGSDYPCKGGEYTITTMNTWAVGSQQTLAFSGSAVHKGGSCQVAYTTDAAPTKNSKFKVIYSIEGGCPVTPDVKFPFTVPKELPNGVGSMAWTWFNQIGVREMYMNCAPVTVTGGSADTSAFDQLPDMATANIGGTCKTTEGFDYTFANPGKYSTRVGPGPFKELCGGAASPGGGQPSAAPSAAPSSVVPPPVSAPVLAPTAAPTSASPPAVTNQPIVSTIRTLVTVTAPVAAPTSDVVIPSSTAPIPTQAPGTPQNGSCATDGAIVCNGTSQFGICNFGKVVWQAVAAGTQCMDGKIAKREYTHRARRSHMY